MQETIVEKPSMIIVGVVGSGADSANVDIPGLWEYFERHPVGVENAVEGTWYEIHAERESGSHFTMVGMEVPEVPASLPADMFVKVLPAATYATFVHHFSDGGFAQAFERVYAWLEDSEYELAHQYDIQCYDDRFRGPGDPESALEIRIPIG